MALTMSWCGECMDKKCSGGISIGNFISLLPVVGVDRDDRGMLLLLCNEKFIR